MDRIESVVTFLADRLPAFTWSGSHAGSYGFRAVGYLGVFGLRVSVLVQDQEIVRVRVHTASRSSDDPRLGYDFLAAVRKTVEAQEFILRALPDFLETLD